MTEPSQPGSRSNSIERPVNVATRLRTVDRDAMDAVRGDVPQSAGPCWM